MSVNQLNREYRFFRVCDLDENRTARTNRAVDIIPSDYIYIVDFDTEQFVAEMEGRIRRIFYTYKRMSESSLGRLFISYSQPAAPSRSECREMLDGYVSALPRFPRNSAALTDINRVYLPENDIFSNSIYPTRSATQRMCDALTLAVRAELERISGIEISNKSKRINLSGNADNVQVPRSFHSAPTSSPPPKNTRRFRQQSINRQTGYNQQYRRVNIPAAKRLFTRRKVLIQNRSLIRTSGSDRSAIIQRADIQPASDGRRHLSPAA